MNAASAPAASTRRLGFATALLLSLTLVACAAPAERDESAPPATSTSPGPTVEEPDAPSDTQTSTPSTQAGVGTLTLPDDAFSFELTFCAIDETDIMIHGPGHSDASGEPGYLSIDFVREASFTTGGARVDLGATTQFQSMDDIYIFSTEYRAGEYSFVIDGESFVLEAEFHGGDGSAVGSGVLTVDCR